MYLTLADTRREWIMEHADQIEQTLKPQRPMISQWSIDREFVYGQSKFRVRMKFRQKDNFKLANCYKK